MNNQKENKSTTEMSIKLLFAKLAKLFSFFGQFC